VRLTWHTPDGRSIPLGSRQVSGRQRVALSQDWDLQRRLGEVAHVGLFAAPAAADAAPATVGAEPPVNAGVYRLVVDAIVFEQDSTLDAELVVYGQVHGIAGTDHQRRDLLLALMWGTPVALAFGLLATAGTTVTTLVIAAAGVWYRGWVDALIQRLTEVNMILPLLPILVMVGTLYSTSIWLMLGVVVVAVNSTFRGAALARMVNLTACRTLVTSGAYLQAIAQVAGELPALTHLLVTDDAPAARALFPSLDVLSLAETASDDDRDLAPDTPDTATAVILFTSGTTGVSKGCAVPHRASLRAAESMVEAFDLTADDCVYSPYPMFHCGATQYDILPAMLVGGRAP